MNTYSNVCCKAHYRANDIYSPIKFPEEPGIYYPDRPTMDHTYKESWDQKTHFILVKDNVYTLSLRKLNRDIPRELKLLNMLEKFRTKSPMSLEYVYGTIYSNKSTMQEVAVFRVAEDSVDLSEDGHSSILLTDKTVNTLCNSIEKELESFNEISSKEEWIELYKADRISLTLERDYWIKLFNERGYVTNKDFISLKHINNNSSLFPDTFSYQVANNYGNLFREHEIEYARFWEERFHFLEPISNLDFRDATGTQLRFLDVGAKLCQEFDFDIWHAIKPLNIKSYGLNGHCYYPGSHHTLFFSFDRGIIFNRLYKIVIISPNHCSNKGLAKLLGEYEKSLYAFPARETLRTKSYYISTDSLKKSKQIQEALEPKGWLVINLTEIWNNTRTKDKN